MSLLSHPFPCIPELENIPEIKRFEDLLDLTHFVYKLVPWMDDQLYYNSMLDIQAYYYAFKQKSVGGWCGINAKMLERILRAYGLYAHTVKHGLFSKQFSHAVVMVWFQAKWILLDPYFSKYYTTLKGNPINFKDLVKSLQAKKFSAFKSVHVGDGCKPIYERFFKNGKMDKRWVEMKPQQLVNNVTKVWEGLHFSDIMKEAFGEKWVFESLLLKPHPGAKQLGYFNTKPEL